MSLRVCQICGDVLDQREAERGACLLCELRTSREERGQRVRLVKGLIDSA
jgi:hypothetical protein